MLEVVISFIGDMIQKEHSSNIENNQRKFLAILSLIELILLSFTCIMF